MNERSEGRRRIRLFVIGVEPIDLRDVKTFITSTVKYESVWGEIIKEWISLTFRIPKCRRPNLRSIHLLPPDEPT